MAHLRHLLATAGLAALLAGGPALAVGPPPPSYPERLDPPHNAAERDAECAAMRDRVATTGGWLKGEGVLGRLNFTRLRHRKAERFLKEYCGWADANGNALSHRSAPRQGLPDLAHPDQTLPNTPGQDAHH